MFSILLLLFSLNILSLSSYISLLLLFYFIFFENKQIAIPYNKTFWLLFVSATLYFSLLFKNFSQINLLTIVSRTFVPVIMMYIGFVRGSKKSEDMKKDFLILTFGIFLHGITNVFTNMNVNILTIEGRMYNDIFGGNITATLQNLMFVLVCSLPFYFIFFEKNRKTKIFGLIAFGLSIYGTVVSASKTIIYLSIIVFCLCIFVYLTKKQGMRRKINVLFRVAILILIGFIIITQDLFGINELIAKTPLGIRYKMSSVNHVSENSRWKYALDILYMLPNYPFGNIPYPHFAHNLWIDIAKETGLLPFILYIIFFILVLKELYVFLKKETIDLEIKILYFSLIMGLTIVSFTEPIMQGIPLIFSIYCFIVGSLIAQNLHTN